MSDNSGGSKCPNCKQMSVKFLNNSSSQGKCSKCKCTFNMEMDEQGAGEHGSFEAKSKSKKRRHKK